MSLSQKTEILNLPEEEVKQFTPDEPGDQADLFAYLEVLVRHRWLTVCLGFHGVVIACSLALVESAAYRAEAVILPVEQLEFLDIAGRRSVASRSFFKEILQSPDTHRRVFGTVYRYEENGRTINGDLGTLLQLNSVHEGIEHLADIVEVEAERSGVITLSIEAESPGLAAAVANGYVEQLRQYYQRRRENQSREQLAFIQDRIVEISGELQGAHAALVEFRRRNLDLVSGLTNGPASGASERAPQFERLNREVEMRSTLLATVMSRYESAKLRAKDESARFEVLSPAEPTDVGSRTAITTRAGIGLAVGLLLGIGVSFIRDYILRQNAVGRLNPILAELRTEKVRVQRLLHWLRPRTKRGQVTSEDDSASVAQA